MNSHSNVTRFLRDSESHKTIPIVETITVDTLSPIQIVEKLKADIVYLLESKDESSSWSRYSFIGLHPFLTLHDDQNEYIARDAAGQEVMKKQELKDLLDWMKEQYQIKTPDADIPFTGGAVGYLSYDLIPSIEPSVRPHRSAPTTDNCTLFVCQTMIAFDHETNHVHFIQYTQLTGNETEDEKIRAYKENQKRLEQMIHKLHTKVDMKELILSGNMNESPSFEHVTSTYEKTQFLKDVEKIKEYIRAGDIFQGVLSQRFDIPVSVSSFELYRVLRIVNPSPYMYFMKLKDRDLVGSSPERLIHAKNRHLEIHPIAGTRKRGATKEEDAALARELLEDEKEKAEHYMLVDLARNDVGRVAEYGSVSVPTFTKVVNFSHVMHIISIVTGKLKQDTHPVDALMSAFPAGTLTGAPKIRAMQLLNEIEPEPRETYGGCIAYIGFDGNIDSCITIRTMSVKDQIASIQAGAGIVADSVPENEWEETCNKAGALLRAIQLAEHIFSEKESVQDESATISSC
ncbi:anthranilate synthase component I [Bacillus altitudinis]|uniref:anthranilate synthase component I n=1 Tax=Bacillus pumilus TaxID=1408 RepID=UPI0025A1F09B|nr:anthranilate synthase component I [Bacillus pumilus]MDM5320435.1 anthranilate synthase component I [Bacillus pumilus]MDR4996203.1 anthranilate synthase component I [Bacillus altitudinis]